MVFGLILGNGNSCNFARYPTRDVKNSTRLRLVEFLTSLVGYLKNTPRTDFKSPKYPSAAPRGIWEIWNRSSGYFFQIVPELHFARDISNKICIEKEWNKIHLLTMQSVLASTLAPHYLNLRSWGYFAQRSLSPSFYIRWKSKTIWLINVAWQLHVKVTEMLRFYIYKCVT